MSDAFTLDAGARDAFAPLPDPIEGTLHRIHIVFQGSDGRRWSAGTDLMAATRESAADFCDGLNVPLGFHRDGWAAFAERVFTEEPHRKDEFASEPFEFTE